ncbi:lytic murein transglycosylase [Alteromonas sp. RKMC-009]|uniref:lytic murein transglycosylase n=1 Tax=Alteromonas sp. RKMC-009 TaxID=2267264 RepID=UPI000E69DA2B|nr:lytic murein transglycosylase [Alteromonas sp. RKMC-009]AYA64997.1 lytic murein transglycosylase [Alteromonas sp. RKMC-009]
MKALVSISPVVLLTVFLLLALPVSAEEKNEAGFKVWLQSLKQEAVEKGYTAELVDKALDTATFRPTIVKADKNQPEKKITLDDYLATRVPDWKVRQAITLYREHQSLLDEIGSKYGVQPRFIVALWGNESNFGKIQGNYPVFSAVLSLAYEGRREAMFKKQFYAALDIIRDGHIGIEALKGSWAGAMGQSQFMPVSFLNYAVDYDGDGRKDIWTTPADVFASIANFLASEGWDDDYTWGRQVKFVDGYDGAHSGFAKEDFVPLTVWQERGVRKFDLSDLPAAGIKASLIMPDGIDGRLYLVYNNFHTLMKWNRSSYFGVSVSYLADRIRKGE